MIIDPKDHRAEYTYVDARTGKTEVDFEYNGPDSWAQVNDGAEEEDVSGILLCAITWDDMWLTSHEIRRMMEKIEALDEYNSRGGAWERMRVVWREDVYHYVLEVPAYKTKEELNAMHAKVDDEH